MPLFTRFIQHLRITSKHVSSGVDEGGAKLELWTSQRRFLEAVANGLENGIHFFVVLKSRQLGLTTICLAIDIFWMALHPNIVGCIVMDNDSNVSVARTTLRKYVQSMGSYLGKSFNIIDDNKNFMTFSNGARMDFLVAGKSKKTWGESRAYAFVHMSEIAKYGQAAGLYSFLEALSEENPDRLYLAESTAFGNNHWRDFWNKAKADPFTKSCIFLGWWSNDLNRIKRTDPRFGAFGIADPSPDENDIIAEVRERYAHEITQEQLAWFRWRKATNSASEGDMDQNQPSTEDDAFVQTGISFFQVRLVGQRIEEIDAAPAALVKDGGYGYFGYRFHSSAEFHNMVMEKIEDPRRLKEVTLRVWEQPSDEGVYAIGFDPAWGRTDWSDRSAIEVYRCFADHLVQVAEFADADLETRQATWVLAYLAGCYKNCMLNIDLQGGPGKLVMAELDRLRGAIRQDLMAERVRKAGIDPDNFLNNMQWYLYRRIDSPGPGFAYNTLTTQNIKFQMMNMLRDSWTSGEIVVRSKPMLYEMLVITQEGPDIGAAAGGRDKDDRTFASGLSNMSWTEHIRPGMIARGETYEKEMAKEAGGRQDVGTFFNRIVADFVARSEAALDQPPPLTPKEERGLV